VSSVQHFAMTGTTSCLNDSGQTSGLWPNQSRFCDFISKTLNYSSVVFCTVYNVYIKLLIFLAVFTLVMMVVKLIAALLVGLAFCIVLFFYYCRCIPAASDVYDP
jgi:hypothetical protein